MTTILKLFMAFPIIGLLLNLYLVYWNSEFTQFLAVWIASHFYSSKFYSFFILDNDYAICLIITYCIILDRVLMQLIYFIVAKNNKNEGLAKPLISWIAELPLCGFVGPFICLAFPFLTNNWFEKDSASMIIDILLSFILTFNACFFSSYFASILKNTK